MPSCFAMRKIGEEERSSLQDVDKAICEHFNIPTDEEKWAYNWYNTIGLALAMGHDWDKIIGFFPEREPIVQFLRDHYITDAWWEGK
jgi:hypothetical protein